MTLEREKLEVVSTEENVVESFRFSDSVIVDSRLLRFCHGCVSFKNDALMCIFLVSLKYMR